MQNQLVATTAMIAFMLLLSPVYAQERVEDHLDKKNESILGLEKEDGTLYSVEEAMNTYGLKGLSVAVFENYEMAWTATWGVKDVISNKKIDVNTAFSAASIAKSITATLLAILEEKGLIDLKAPVSSYLKRWKLPDSEFTQDVDVTLEHLLSHTAGTSQHGFADFYLGDIIPTLVQSLKGELPKYDREIEFLFTPGSDWRYSGGGYVIAQVAVEDHLGKSLADLANQYLFSPLEFRNTTMKQPNEKGFLSNVAKAHNHDEKVIRTGIPITPQVAPSGLWTTPSDMATFMIEMQNALRGAETKVISPKVAKRVTGIITAKVIGGYGLGWERRFGFGNYEWFSHGGANTGIGGHIYATMQDGNGIAFFGNGPNPNRIPVLDQFRNSIIKAHEWSIPLAKTKRKTITQDFVDKVKGTYSHVLFGEMITVDFDDGKLLITDFVPGKSKAELIYIGDQTFVIDEYPSKLKFGANPADGLDYIALIRNGMENSVEYAYKRIQEDKKKVYVCPPCGVDCHDAKYSEPGICPVCGMSLVVERKAPPQAPPRYEIDTTDVWISSDGVQLGASYYVPQGLTEPLPAAVIVHGSSPSTRNDVGFFTRMCLNLGFAVLAYDKRGVGESTGRYRPFNVQDSENIFEELAADVQAATRWLKTQKEVDATRIGLVGGSQAGWIMPLAASKTDGVRFIVAFAGTPVSAGEEAYHGRLTGDGGGNGLPIEEADSLLAQYDGPKGFDPGSILRKATAKMLWIFGTKDVVIPTHASIAELERIIEKDNSNHEIHIIEAQITILLILQPANLLQPI